jgi:hypothetical protein
MVSSSTYCIYKLILWIKKSHLLCSSSSAGKIWENVEFSTQGWQGFSFLGPISVELCSSQGLVAHPHKHASTETEEQTAYELLVVGMDRR